MRPPVSKPFSVVTTGPGMDTAIELPNIFPTKVRFRFPNTGKSEADNDVVGLHV